jgi:uncharacterized alpha-E superfamily protein
MLSRTAERLYWLARYLERSENLARLINVHMNLLLDLPPTIAMNWQKLLYITGTREQFYLFYQTANETNVNHFLLTQLANAGSLSSAIHCARENIRTSRHLLPDEAWEVVNELYLYVKEQINSVNNRRERGLFLRTVLAYCQQFNGLLVSTMSQTDAYYFIQIGQNLERADMCTRILELASILLVEDRSEQLKEYEGILWMNILKAQGGLAIYRQELQGKIQGDEVFDYLLKNPTLPRSISFCLQQLYHIVTQLPYSESIMVMINDIQQDLQTMPVQQTSPDLLNQQQDYLQSQFAHLHQQITQTWFLTA